MRDSLYRICEAYSNGVIDQIQLVRFMSRSQDLTAVVLAIEQLTGAVAASQVILTGTAGAGASASLLANQQLLDAARKDEEVKTKSINDAKKERDTAKKFVDDKEAEVAIAEDAHQQATARDSTVSEAKRIKLEADLNTKKNDLKTLEANLAAAEGQVKTTEALLTESRRTRETIENLKEAALTNAVSNTTGAGEFNTPVQRKELSKDATSTIADAVKYMVGKVLDKKYTEDTCMALITSSPQDFDKWSDDRKKNYKEVHGLCANLVSAGLVDAIKKTEATFGPDITTQRIKRALDNDSALRGHMNKWLTSQGLGISTTLLIYGSEYADLRQKAIKELSIP